MKRLLIIALLGIVSGSCSYRMAVFRFEAAPGQAVEDNPASNGRSYSEARPFKYASPKTHRDSVLFNLEKASREAARAAWEATKHKYPGYSKNTNK